MKEAISKMFFPWQTHVERSAEGEDPVGQAVHTEFILINPERHEHCPFP